MSVDVYTYDPGFSPLASSLEAATVNSISAVIITKKLTGPIGGGEWGALLALPGATMFEVLVNDTAGRYAPFHAGDLNGKKSCRINAIIHALPTHSHGFAFGTSGSAADLVRAVSGHKPWSPDEKEGVIGLYQAHAELAPRPADHEIRQIVDRWYDQLKQLGIDVSATAVATARYRTP